MKLLVIVGKKAVRLVASMVLGAETPVNIGENCLVLVVYCAEDAAAYFLSLLE